MIQFHLKQSKCDQFGKGADVVVGRSLASVCSVEAVLEYIEQRKDVPGAFFSVRKEYPPQRAGSLTKFEKFLGLLGYRRTNTLAIVSELEQPQQLH